MGQPAGSPRFRFSIRGVLFVTALIAAFFAPAVLLGGGYFFSATPSLFLFWAVRRALRSKRTFEAFVVCLVTFLLGIIAELIPLLLHSVATGLVCLLTIPIREHVQWRVWACAVMILAAYFPAFSWAITHDSKIVRARKAWPFESIASRLPARGVLGTQEAVKLSAAQEAVLMSLDLEAETLWHVDGLERLHNEEHRRFSRAIGLSSTLTLIPWRYRIELVRPIDVKAEFPVELPAGASSEADEIHFETQAAFLDTARSGYAESRERVAGFLGHGFSRLPFEEPDWYGPRVPAENSSGGEWRLDRLELIGLVLQDEPAAYVSDKLPNMEELRDAPTRPLEDFESEALEKLRGQEDLVIVEPASEGGAHLRMVGAIRAGNSCAVCHEVPYGTLLGAFSYDLTKLPNRPGSLPREPVSTR